MKGSVSLTYIDSFTLFHDNETSARYYGSFAIWLNLVLRREHIECRHWRQYWCVYLEDEEILKCMGTYRVEKWVLTRFGPHFEPVAESAVCWYQPSVMSTKTKYINSWQAQLLCVFTQSASASRIQWVECMLLPFVADKKHWWAHWASYAITKGTFTLDRLGWSRYGL